MYELQEVDGVTFAPELHKFNALVSEWPPLQPRHIENGYWWLVFLGDEPVAFAGLVANEPFDRVGVGYLKRCYVKPDHHGHGLQFRMIAARELKAKQLGWTMLVSECDQLNLWSAANFRKAGFSVTNPEQRWGDDPERSIYWVKSLV
jgi:GNAT superfamily N-acetyltransferase